MCAYICLSVYLKAISRCACVFFCGCVSVGVGVCVWVCVCVRCVAYVYVFVSATMASSPASDALIVFCAAAEMHQLICRE